MYSDAAASSTAYTSDIEDISLRGGTNHSAPGARKWIGVMSLATLGIASILALRAMATSPGEVVEDTTASVGLGDVNNGVLCPEGKCRESTGPNAGKCTRPDDDCRKSATEDACMEPVGGRCRLLGGILCGKETTCGPSIIRSLCAAEDCGADEECKLVSTCGACTVDCIKKEDDKSDPSSSKDPPSKCKKGECKNVEGDCKPKKSCEAMTCTETSQKKCGKKGEKCRINNCGGCADECVPRHGESMRDGPTRRKQEEEVVEGGM